MEQTKKTYPKLTVEKVLRKFTLNLDIKLTNSIPVYYYWDKKKQPEWILNKKSNRYEPVSPYFTIDYDSKLREWYIGYIYDIDIKAYGTIDDITGTCSIDTR